MCHDALLQEQRTRGKVAAPTWRHVAAFARSVQWTRLAVACPHQPPLPAVHLQTHHPLPAGSAPAVWQSREVQHMHLLGSSSFTAPLAHPPSGLLPPSILQLTMPT